MKAIILAGGFGTRLNNHIVGIPKPMADISGRPFLEYLLNYLIRHNFTEVIISVHHLKDVIINYFGNDFRGIKIRYAIENEPLGTGGAILHSLNCAGEDGKFFVLNGDCFQEINYPDFYDKNKNGMISIAVRKVNESARYGFVEVLGDKVISFKEKGSGKDGYINAGCYLIDSKWFKSLNLPSKFSFETDFLEKYTSYISPYIVNGYFVDIGIPEDYIRAQGEIPLFN